MQPTESSSIYLHQIQAAVAAVDNPHTAGRYFVIKNGHLGTTVECPKDMQLYEREMTAYIRKIENIPYASSIHQTLGRMQELVNQQLRISKSYPTTPEIKRKQSIDSSDWIISLHDRLKATEHKLDRPYLNFDEGCIITSSKKPDSPSDVVGGILDKVETILTTQNLTPEEESSLKYILMYLAEKEQLSNVKDTHIDHRTKLIDTITAREHARDVAEGGELPKINLEERAPTISLPKDQAILPALTKIAFDNCKNDKDSEKKALEGLGSLRFANFVPLGELKADVERLKNRPNKTPEQNQDLEAKQAILTWMENHPGPIPSLAEYAGDRLEEMSDIEQFYVNLYHDFQGATKAEIETKKDQIKSALSYQDLYALQLLRRMKRNDPPLVDINSAPKAMQQRAAGDAYSNKSLIEFYVDSYTKQLKGTKYKANIEQLEKEVSTLDNLKQKLDEMDASKTGYKEAASQIRRKIAVLEKENPHSKLQILISIIKEEATTKAVKENLPVVIAAGFYDPNEFGKDIIYLLEGEVPISKNPLLLMSEDNLQVNERSDISLYVEVMLSRYVETGKLKRHQKEVILEEVDHLIENYQKVFPGKDLKQIYNLCVMAARTMAYQEYYDKAAFTGSDHGTKHIHHNILMANQFVDGIKTLSSSDVKKKDVFAIQLVHIFHDFGYSTGLAGINFNACKDHPIVSAAFLNANKQFFVDILDEDTYDAVVRSVQNHAIIRPDFTPDQGRFLRTFTSNVQSNLVRALTSTSDSCALTADRKTQEFWEDLEAIKIAARLKVFVTNHPEYQDKFSPPPPQSYKENYRDQLLNSTNPMDRLAAEIYDSVLDDLKGLIHDNPNLHPDLKERFMHAIEEQFSYFAANMVVGQFGAVLEGVGVRRNEGAGPKYLPEFDISPSSLYAILEVGFSEKEAFAAFKKLLDEFSARPDKLEQATKETSQKLRAIYEMKADFEKKYPFCKLEEAEDLHLEDFVRRKVFPTNSQVQIKKPEEVEEFNWLAKVEQKNVIVIDDPSLYQTSHRTPNDVYLYVITPDNTNDYMAFESDYRAVKLRIRTAVEGSEHDVTEANAHFHVHAHPQLEKPEEHRFGSAAGRHLEQVRRHQAVTGPAAAPFAEVLERLSQGNKRKGELEEGLRIGKVNPQLVKNVDLQAAEFQTAQGLLQKINADWQTALQPIKQMFENNKDSLAYESSQKVLKQYVRELEALRDNPAKFTEKAVKDLNDKYKNKFEDIDTFYNEQGVKTNFKDTFDNSTKTLAAILCPNANKWGEGEKLLKNCFTYLTTQMMSERSLLFLLPNVTGTQNALIALKLDATDKLKAQSLVTQNAL